MPNIAKLACVFAILATAAASISSHQGQGRPPLAGGDECLFCHRGTVGAVWQKNAHFLTVRDKFLDMREAPEINLLRAEERFKKYAAEVGYVMGGKRSIRFLRERSDGRFEILGVAATIGAGRPILESKGEPGWDATKFSERCIGCHMTGVDPKTLVPFETFVGCETCHGPYDERHTAGAAFMRFARKAKDLPQVVAFACGQCHLRGGRSRSTGRPFPNNFTGGDLLKDFQFDFSGADDPNLNPMDAHIQRNIRDVLAGKSDLTCLSCHKIHPSSAEIHRRRPRSDYCLTCHMAEPFKQIKKYEAHSDLCEY
jgi:hypothetical protein